MQEMFGPILVVPIHRRLTASRIAFTVQPFFELNVNVRIPSITYLNCLVDSIHTLPFFVNTRLGEHLLESLFLLLALFLLALPDFRKFTSYGTVLRHKLASFYEVFLGLVLILLDDLGKGPAVQSLRCNGRTFRYV
ncbi:hypothetical protein H2248_003735 [Termitomyces sp. 'cryptogamus']|nr:hypothetical protein H2248_003735 [Termitomyces sp. 'cryptogamus']